MHETAEQLSFEADSAGSAVLASVALQARSRCARIQYSRLILATLTCIAGAVLASPFFVFYAKCFRGQDHLRRILDEAQTIFNDALAAVTPRGHGLRKEHERTEKRT